MGETKLSDELRTVLVTMDARRNIGPRTYQLTQTQMGRWMSCAAALEAEIERLRVEAERLQRLEDDRWDLWVSPSFAEDEDGQNLSRLGMEFLRGQEFSTLRALADALRKEQP